VEFIPNFISFLQKIILDTNTKIGLASSHPEVLDAGIWYGAEYYRALSSKNPRNSINALLQKGLFQGLAPLDVISYLKNEKSPTGYSPFTFLLKKGVKPSYALSKIEKGLSFLDCSTVVMLGLYKALLVALEEDKFDVLFASDSAFPFRLSGNSSPLSKIVEYKKIVSEEDIQVGDICYFSNVKEYVAKHPLGESRGDYVVCVSNSPRLYIGFGLPHLGMDKNKVEKELLDCYNRDPVDLQYFDPKIINYLHAHYFPGDVQKGKALVKSFASSILSWDDFVKKPSRAEVLGHKCLGKMGLWVYRIDLDKVEKIAFCEKQKCVELLASFA
jgi:hypothetical protein